MNSLALAASVWTVFCWARELELWQNRSPEQALLREGVWQAICRLVGAFVLWINFTPNLALPLHHVVGFTLTAAIAAGYVSAYCGCHLKFKVRAFNSVNVLNSVIVAAFEELLFRFHLQSGLIALKGQVQGVLLTALVFGLIHVKRNSLFGVFYITCMGLILSWAATIGIPMFYLVAAHTLMHFPLFFSGKGSRPVAAYSTVYGIAAFALYQVVVGARLF